MVENPPQRSPQNQPEDEQPIDIEAGADTEHEPLSLEDELLELSADLGFIESDALRKVRESISAQMPEADSFQLIAEYQNLARELTPSENDPEGSSIVMGVNVAAVAAILRSGRVDDAREELETLVMAAENLDEQDLADYLSYLRNSIH